MLPDSVRQVSARSLPSIDLSSWVLTHWRPLTLGALVLLAAIARIYDVTDNPRGFFTDEASFGLNADLILHTGRDEHGKSLPLLFESFGEYKLPAFIYAEVPFMAVFGRSEEAVRLTAAVFGSLTVVTTYLLAKELFQRELPAVAAAACLAILPWHIHYSRTGLGDIVMLPLFFTLGFYLFFRAIRDQRFLIPAAVVLAATFYTYRGGWLVMPPTLLFVVVAYRQELLKYRQTALIAAAVGLIILVPLAVHLLFGPSDRVSQAWIFNLESEKSTFQLFRDFFRSYYTYSFLFEEGDNGPITRHFLPGQGELYLIQLPLILLGIVWLVTHFNRRHLFALALLWLFPLSAAVSDTSPISSRAILGAVSFSLLTGAGLWALVRLVESVGGPRGRVVAAGAVAIVVVAAALSFASYAERYHRDYPALSAGYWGWQDGPQAIIAKFVGLEDRYDELFMDGTFNAPHIFFPFYAEGECGNCGIGDSERYDPDERQLFALRPESLKADKYDYRVVDRLFYPDGSVSFLFVEITGRH